MARAAHLLRYTSASHSQGGETLVMIGAIAGDVIGSVHEWSATKTKDFPLFVAESTFTDDSVLTLAVAEWILEGSDLVEVFHAYFHRFPDRGYGGRFLGWATDRDREPYNSYGNGSAMRVSAVGFAFDDAQEVLHWAERSAAVTHNHEEGVKGAKATALAVLLARKSTPKEEIKLELQSRFGYDLDTSLAEIRPGYLFNESCQGTVPQAIVAFLESRDYEDAIRNAISLGGDADTLACIAGGIAEAYYGGVPRDIEIKVRE